MNQLDATQGAATAVSVAHSRPDEAVRHDYPLAVQDAGLSTAVGLVAKTLPYALARFGVLVAVSVATIVWYVVTFGGFGFLASKLHPWAGFAWLIACLAVYGVFWRTLVRYFLYLLKAGHIAVLTELVLEGRIGNGQQNMFEYGKNVVKERFGQVNAMFALDVLVHGVVRAFNRTLDWVASLLPIPGLQGITSVIDAVLYSATTFIDETIFSYALARRDPDNLRSSRDGLIYYAQNCKEILKTATWIVVLDKASTVAVWFFMLLPAFVITAILPASIAGAGGMLVFVVSALLAWNLRAAFLEPLFLTMVMVKFHVTVQGQAIDPVWDERLTSVSDKFVELKNRIADAAPRPAAAAS